MPIDKIKHPDKYLVCFHNRLQHGHQGYIVFFHQNKQRVESLSRKFRAFRKSLQDYPLHPSAIAVKDCTVRTKVKQLEDGDWGLFVIVKPIFQFPEPIADSIKIIINP